MTSERKAPSAHAGPRPKIGPFAQLIFGSRWLQVPLYVGLAIIIYVAFEMIYRGSLELAPVIASL